MTAVPVNMPIPMALDTVAAIEHLLSLLTPMGKDGDTNSNITKISAIVVIRRIGYLQSSQDDVLVTFVWLSLQTVPKQGGDGDRLCSLPSHYGFPLF